MTPPCSRFPHCTEEELQALRWQMLQAQLTPLRGRSKHRTGPTPQICTTSRPSLPEFSFHLRVRGQMLPASPCAALRPEGCSRLCHLLLWSLGWAGGPEREGSAPGDLRGAGCSHHGCRDRAGQPVSMPLKPRWRYTRFKD